MKLDLFGSSFLKQQQKETKETPAWEIEYERRRDEAHSRRWAEEKTKGCGDGKPSFDFVAIDLEYADRQQHICQFGLAVVRDLEVVERRCWNIQPPGNRYDARYVMTHHMTAADTADAPTFQEIWPEIEVYLRGQKLWAHNSISVEQPVLNKNLCMHGIGGWYWVEDSRTLYLRTDCEAGKGNGLEQCCMALGLPCENHHNAGADAEMCARIVIANLSGEEPDWSGVPVTKEDMRKAEQTKRVLRLGGFAEYFADTSSGEENVFAVLSSTCEGAEERTIDVFDKGDKISGSVSCSVDFSRLDTGSDNPLCGKRVVVTGMFRFNRNDIERAIEMMGAKKVPMPNGKTDAVVFGTRNVGPNKLLALEEQEAAGHHIARIVGDEDLEQLLYGDGKKFF